MKIRSGFVSNSSSSSFVFVGAPIQAFKFTEEEMDTLYDEEGYLSVIGDGEYIGAVVVRIDEGSVSQFTIEDVNKEFTKFNKYLLEKYNKTVDAKLYAGEFYS